MTITKRMSAELPQGDTLNDYMLTLADVLLKTMRRAHMGEHKEIFAAMLLPEFVGNMIGMMFKLISTSPTPKTNQDVFEIIRHHLDDIAGTREIPAAKVPDWKAGVVFAAGFLATDHGEDTYARDLLEAAGFTSMQDLKKSGATKYDIARCKPAFMQEKGKQL